MIYSGNEMFRRKSLKFHFLFLPTADEELARDLLDSPGPGPGPGGSR